MSLNPSPYCLRGPHGKWKKICKSESVWNTSKKQDPVNQHDQNSYKLIETEAAYTAPA